MDGRAESDGGAAAQVRAGQHHRVGRQEHLIAGGDAGELRVRTHQHPVTDEQRVRHGAAQHRVLHDHAPGADLHRAALGGQHRAVRQAAAGADADLAAEHRGGRHIGVGVDPGSPAQVPDRQRPRAHRGAGRAAGGRGAGWAVASSVTVVSVAFTMVSILGSCRSWDRTLMGCRRVAGS